jgi:hypothetical protein
MAYSRISRVVVDSAADAATTIAISVTRWIERMEQWVVDDPGPALFSSSQYVLPMHVFQD